jgi:hypothetical protein
MSRNMFFMLVCLVVAIVAVLVAGRALSFGRLLGFVEVFGRAFALLWRVVLVVVIIFWLRALLGGAKK